MKIKDVTYKGVVEMSNRLWDAYSCVTLTAPNDLHRVQHKASKQCA